MVCFHCYRESRTVIDMKKCFRTTVLLTLVIAMALSLGTTASAVKDKDYEYVLNENNEATITAYNGDGVILTIPDVIDEYPVVGIGDLAFAGNENLYRVNIPLSVKEIGINPFAGCTDLRRIYVSPRHDVFSTDSGVLFNKLDKKLISISPQMWISYTVPNGVEIIGEKAFYGASELEGVKIPSSVKTIEAGAFENCESFTEITLPDGVVSIGTSAFENCISLKTIDFPKKLASIGDYAFKNCAVMEGLELPEELISIGNGAFAECSALTEMILPASVEKVGSEAFKNCTELSDVNILAGGLTELGTSAFEGCSSIEMFAVPGSVKEVPAGLCSGCTALELINIMEGIESVGEGAFSGCENLRAVFLYDGLKSIEQSAFSDCSRLYEMELPDSVTSIKPDSFSGCYDLRLEVNRDTYNEKYAIENSVYYIFPDSYDWLLPPIAIGDIIKLGRYEQDADESNGAEEIEWIVIDIDEATDSALIISRYALDCVPFNKQSMSVTWETCNLRKWLNGDFYNVAFSPEEQAMIETTEVAADINSKYSTDPGKNTTDLIFLLSIDEVNRCFSGDEVRKCAPTPFAKKNGAYINDSTKCCWWWLRSPGSRGNYAADIYDDGSVSFYGDAVSNTRVCVRPALRINLHS